MHAKKIGNWGESLAEGYFVALGYEVVARNFRKRGGEIDLIMRRGASFLFIEVKTRHAANQSSRPEDIDPHQVRRLGRMIERYVMQHAIEQWRCVLVCLVYGDDSTVRCIELTDSLDLG